MKRNVWSAAAVKKHNDRLTGKNTAGGKTGAFSGVTADGRYIFISGEVMSSKNSKIAVIKKEVNPKTGKQQRSIINSTQVQTYIKQTRDSYILLKNAFRQMASGQPKPLIVEFTFLRRTSGIFDFVNMVQLVLDLMVKNGWITDDNMAEILPIPPLKPPHYYVNPEKPGVYIRVIKGAELTEIVKL